jgi:chromosome segregation ATPase
MDENTITDLKQFIAATVSQQTSDLRQDISGVNHDIVVLKQDVSSLKQDIVSIDRKIDNLSPAVAEAIDNANEHTESRLNDHENRIARLEHKPA